MSVVTVPEKAIFTPLSSPWWPRSPPVTNGDSKLVYALVCIPLISHMTMEE